MNNRGERDRREVLSDAISRPRRRFPRPNGAVLILSIILILIVVFSVYVIISRGGGENNIRGDVSSGDEANVSHGGENSISSGGDMTGTFFEDSAVKVQLPDGQLYRGELILVNFEHEYHFPEDGGIVSVFDFKSPHYKVSNTSVALRRDIIDIFNAMLEDFYLESSCSFVTVVSGFRTREFQEDLLRRRVESDGQEEAIKYVALPGCSEHHTGLAMDLSVYDGEGRSYYLSEYQDCAWLRENFYRYGFVLRYPEEKADITRTAYESWHYRYVGIPHSYIMDARGLCLEEYIEFLGSYTFESPLVFRYGDGYGESFRAQAPEDIRGADYIIYTVPADVDYVMVPEGYAYTLSGSNTDFIIVTAELK